MGIAQGVRGHVGIGVPGQPDLARPQDPASHRLRPSAKAWTLLPMPMNGTTGSDGTGSPASGQDGLGDDHVERPVTSNASSCPGTTWTGMPRRSTSRSRR